MSENPRIIARHPDSPGHGPDDRAGTNFVGSAEAEYLSGAVGTARVEVFRSNDAASHGGVVLRMTIDDKGSSWLPHARETPNGLEISLAGEYEGDAMLRAIAGAIAAAQRPGTV